MRGIGRLLQEYVEASTGDLAVAQRRRECHLVVDAAARGVDEIRRWLHRGELRGTEHAEGLRSSRAVHGDVIGTAQQLVQLHFLRATCLALFGREVRVVGEHRIVEQHAA